MMRYRSFFRKAYLKWILLLPVGIGVALFVSRWAFIFWPLFCFLVFLRVAQDLPYVGPAWRSMFGEKTLWDWLSLLIVPGVLTTIGFQFSSLNSAADRINAQRTMRSERYSKYLELIRDYVISDDLARLGKETQLQIQDTKSRRLGCILSAQSPKAILVQNLTDATLSQISLLATKEDRYLDEKGMTLRFLYKLGLLYKERAIINPEGFDFSRGNFYQARLANSCLNSVMFADSAASKESSSDFRDANLEGANLSGANLARANFRGASLQNAVLVGWASLYKADLRGANLRGIKYDETTMFDGAIFNTQTIKAGRDRQGWWGALLCGFRIRMMGTSAICMDAKDYKDLPPTRFPDEFYPPGSLDSKTGFRTTRPLMKELRRLNYRLPLVENNDLP